MLRFGMLQGIGGGLVTCSNHNRTKPHALLLPNAFTRTQHNGNNLQLCVLVLLIYKLPLLVYSVDTHYCQMEQGVIIYMQAIMHQNVDH